MGRFRDRPDFTTYIALIVVLAALLAVGGWYAVTRMDLWNYLCYLC